MEETSDINTLQLDNLVVNSVFVHALWLENLHLTHTSSNELLYHVRSRVADQMKTEWLHNLLNPPQPIQVRDALGLIICFDKVHGRASGFSLERAKWPRCGAFVCRPWSHFCMSHWRGRPLTPSFQQRYWNHSGSMSAWTAVIVSQSSCHRVTSFAQRSSQLLHALPCYYLLLNIIKTWNSTKM